MSGRPGTSQLHRISALRASSAIAAGTPRAKSPPPRFSAFHPAHVVASQSLEPCTKSYRAPAQAHISQPIVAQVAHIAHTSSRSRQPPTLHHTFVPTCRSDSRPSTPKLTRCWGAGAWWQCARRDLGRLQCTEIETSNEAHGHEMSEASSPIPSATEYGGFWDRPLCMAHLRGLSRPVDALPASPMGDAAPRSGT